MSLSLKYEKMNINSFKSVISIVTIFFNKYNVDFSSDEIDLNKFSENLISLMNKSECEIQNCRISKSLELITIIWYFILNKTMILKTLNKLYNDKINNLNEYLHLINALENFDFYNKLGSFVINENIIENVLECINIFNFFCRLRINTDQLNVTFNLKENQPLRCPLPTEMCDQDLWRTIDNPHQFIGHGFYWVEGNVLEKDILGSGDYDNFECGYIKINNCSITAIDIELLKKDFSFLSKLDDKSIVEWFLNECCFISEGLYYRLKDKGDLFGKLDFINTDMNDVDTLKYKEVENDIDSRINKDIKRIGIRYKGGGRATNFICNNKFKFSSKKNQLSELESNIFEKMEEIECDLINIKGLGTELIAPNLTEKENGLLSMIDAIKEYSFEKLINKTFYNKSWGTVGTYGIIDLNIKFKNNAINKATSFIGEKCCLVVRQCSGRLVSSQYEYAYYSVATSEIIEKYLKDCIIDLNSFNLTSEQFPSLILSKYIEYLDKNKSKNSEKIKKIEQLKENICEWNIQTDVTSNKLIDFSQYYFVPFLIDEKIKKLFDLFIMTNKAFVDGLICHKESYKLLLNDEDFLLFINENIILESKDGKKEDVNKEYIFNRKEILVKKYGDIVTKMNKSNHSWSWFLEIDDSKINDISSDIGGNNNIKVDEYLSKFGFKNYNDFISNQIKS